jgi:hypothetical protein
VLSLIVIGLIVLAIAAAVAFVALLRGGSWPAENQPYSTAGERGREMTTWDLCDGRTRRAQRNFALPEN